MYAIREVQPSKGDGQNFSFCEPWTGVSKDDSLHVCHRQMDSDWAESISRLGVKQGCLPDIVRRRLPTGDTIEFA